MNSIPDIEYYLYKQLYINVRRCYREPFLLGNETLYDISMILQYYV